LKIQAYGLAITIPGFDLAVIGAWELTAGAQTEHRLYAGENFLVQRVLPLDGFLTLPEV
jgi:hypothetical protein